MSTVRDEDKDQTSFVELSIRCWCWTEFICVHKLSKMMENYGHELKGSFKVKCVGG